MCKKYSEDIAESVAILMNTMESFLGKIWMNDLIDTLQRDSFDEVVDEICDDPTIMSDDSSSVTCDSPQTEFDEQEVNSNWQNEWIRDSLTMQHDLSSIGCDLQQQNSRKIDFNWENKEIIAGYLKPIVSSQQEFSYQEKCMNICNDYSVRDNSSGDLDSINVMPLNLPIMQTNEFEKRLYKTSNEAPNDPDDFILPREIPSNINEILQNFTKKILQAPITTNNIDCLFQHSSEQKAPNCLDQVDQKRNKITEKKARCQPRESKYKHRKTRDKPNNCYHLWTFLEELLKGTIYPDHNCVEWADRENREFRITNTKLLAHLWGQKKGSDNMTYDKLSRTFRYYCTYDILKKIDGKRLQFKFGEKRMWSKESS